ncbi:2217_t:CDS:2 [Acaulospora colombiana]|uniref:2217_t:CDS:1 n=1 Tax=Acaulospora colombiana TaxID=27376 RepID=A0ACA9JXQ8_9GLOM|nr:2217_t:CDS:2 [Acaulospora colombiana]
MMEENTTENSPGPTPSSILVGSVSSTNTNTSSSLTTAVITAAPLKINLRVHPKEFSDRDFVITMDGIKPGQFLEIYNLNEESNNSKHFVFRVEKECIKDRTERSNLPTLQISVANHIANLFKFANNSHVMVREIDEQIVASTHEADYIEFCFKDQYIGRKNTKAIFRSESAKIFILVQMSREMWEFDEDGDLYYEKTVDGFFVDLFNRLKKNQTNHVISIVLFSRIVYDYNEDLAGDGSFVNEPPLMRDQEGRCYKDFYKVIVDWETKSDWSMTLKELKNELMNYQQNILLRKKQKGDGIYRVLSGKNSYAFSGNILEAINLALNPFDRHYVDRDLSHTGLSIIVVTPGCGRFEVDKKTLRITTERMVDNGIGLDLVCLSKVPLHRVPLFKFKSLEISKARQKISKDQQKLEQENKLQTPDHSLSELRDPLDYDEDQNEANYSYYKTPDWVDCTFYPGNRHKLPGPDKFVTQCKMYEIQMMGIMEHEISSILIPDLEESPYSRADNIFDYDGYDENIFSSRSKQNGFNGGHSNINLKQHYPHMDFESANLSIRSPDYPQSQRIYDEIAQFPSKNQLSDMSKSFPKALTTVVAHHGQNWQYDISKQKFHSLHDHHQEDGFGCNGQMTEDDVTYVTNSKTKPIAIHSPHRIQRNLNQDPPPSHVGNHDFYMNDKENRGKSLANPLPEEHTTSRQLHRSTFVNPSNLSKNSDEYGVGTYLRWEHAYPIPKQITFMKWSALCTPASLPVTTDYFPPIKEHNEHTYNMSLERNEEYLLNELINQRLSQGYQLITPSNYPKNLNTQSYYLSMGRHVHHLKYDLSNQQVEVKRYVRKIYYDQKPISYTFAILPRLQESYQTKKVEFCFPKVDYKWNDVDKLVCGFHDDILERNELLEQLKFWKTRFILIPTEGFQPGKAPVNEEDRMDGIFNFLEAFEKAAWVPHDVRTDNKNDITSLLRCTTLDLSDFLKNPDDPYPRNPAGNPVFTKDSKPEDIVAAMLSPTADLVRDHNWRFGTHQNAMRGSDLVVWLMRNFSDIKTRKDAVEFGKSLQGRGIIEHCEHKHPFADGYNIYQICVKYAPRRPSPKGFFFNHVLRGNSAAQSKKSLSSKDSRNKDEVVELTKAIFIDIDPSKKSDRKETATLHYDIIYNPDNCYHFQLNWLGCTSSLIDEMLGQWSKMANKHGLKLVEAPVDQAINLYDNNPFQFPTVIQLSVPPPSLEPFKEKLRSDVDPDLYFEEQLVKKFEFVLDVEADCKFPDDVKVKYSYSRTHYKYSQYIHRTGVAFIQIGKPGEGLFFVNNRLFITRNPKNQANPDLLMKDIQDFCQDEMKLKKFWEEVIKEIPLYDGADSHEYYEPEGKVDEDNKNNGSKIVNGKVNGKSGNDKVEEEKISDDKVGDNI